MYVRAFVDMASAEWNSIHIQAAVKSAGYHVEMTRSGDCECEVRYNQIMLTAPFS